MFQFILLLIACRDEVKSKPDNPKSYATQDRGAAGQVIAQEQGREIEGEEQFIERMLRLVDTSKLLEEAADFVKNSDRFALIEFTHRFILDDEEAVILYDNKYQFPIQFYMEGQSERIEGQEWRGKLSYFQDQIEEILYEDYNKSRWVKVAIEGELFYLSRFHEGAPVRERTEHDRRGIEIFEDILKLVEDPDFKPSFRFASSEAYFDQNLLHLMVLERAKHHGNGARKALLTLIKRLLEKGVDPNYKTFVAGKTALHLAGATDLELIALLKEHGADPSVKDLSGRRAEDFYPYTRPVTHQDPLPGGQTISSEREDDFIKRVISLRSIDELQAEEQEMLRHSPRFSLIKDSSALGIITLIYDAKYQQVLAIDIEGGDSGKREKIKKLLLYAPGLLPLLYDSRYQSTQDRLKREIDSLKLFFSLDSNKENFKAQVMESLDGIERAIGEADFYAGVRFKSPMNPSDYSPISHDFNLIHMLVYLLTNLKLNEISWRAEAEGRAKALIERLVREKSLSINYKTFESQFTALHLAKMGEDEELAEFLIGLGADPELRDMFGLAPGDY